MISAFRVQHWALLAALIVVSGCHNSVDLAPGEQQASDVDSAALPAEEIAAPPAEPSAPAPEPSAPVESPLVPPVSDDTEPAAPAPSQNPQDLTADLDAFFNTAPEARATDLKQPENDAPPAQDMGSLFGDLIASGAETRQGATAKPTEPPAATPPAPFETLPPESPAAIAALDEPDPPSEPSQPRSDAQDITELFPPVEALTESDAPPPIDPPEDAFDTIPDEPALPEWLPERPAQAPPIDIPAAEEPAPAKPAEESPALPFEKPAPVAKPEPLPQIEEPNPPAEPPLAEAPPAPAAHPTPPRSPKRPVLDVNNTRHLAWVLGAKLSLMAAPGAGADAWEPRAVAEMLGVPTPSVKFEEDEGANVSRLLKAAAVLGDRLTQDLGADHAALLEIAVKSNAVAALYESHPELGAPVAKAIEKAAARAGLDEQVCAPLIATLRGEPTADAVRAAVFTLHSTVDQVLREP